VGCESAGLKGGNGQRPFRCKKCRCSLHRAESRTEKKGGGAGREPVERRPAAGGFATPVVRVGTINPRTYLLSYGVEGENQQEGVVEGRGRGSRSELLSAL